MFQKTRGIVLYSIKYSDTSLIVKIYTETFGLVSYIVRYARSRKSGMKAGLFQPLTLMEFVASHKKKTGLQTIKEIIQCYQFSGIPYDIKKSSVAIFMAEVLQKAIHEEEQNKSLFEFINNSVELLDKTEGRISEFHLYFMIKLSGYLGFYPNNNFNESNRIFNLYDGQFQGQIPEHNYYIEKETSEHLHQLINSSYSESHPIVFPVAVKKELLNKILDYYRIHLNGFNTLRSHAILEEVFV